LELRPDLKKHGDFVVPDYVFKAYENHILEFSNTRGWQLLGNKRRVLLTFITDVAYAAEMTSQGSSIQLIKEFRRKLDETMQAPSTTLIKITIDPGDVTDNDKSYAYGIAKRFGIDHTVNVFHISKNQISFHECSEDMGQLYALKESQITWEFPSDENAFVN